MAALDNASKAPLIVTTPSGTLVDNNHMSLSVAPTGVVEVAGDDGFGHPYVVGLATGTATITVHANGMEGAIEVTVTAAPLTVSLGSAIPK